MNRCERQQKLGRQRKPGMRALLIWNVPKELKARFKASCARKQISMEKAVVSLLERFIRD